MSAVIEDGRGNRLVYKASPLQGAVPRSAPPETPPPPRERTLIMPLEALRALPSEPAPTPPKVEQPVPLTSPPRMSRGWLAIAAVAVAAFVIALAALAFLF